MDNLVQFYPNDYCFECNTYKSIVGITDNNEQIPIDNLYNLNKYTLLKLKCKKCKKEYDIDWTKDRLPKPKIQEIESKYFFTKI